MEYIRLTKISFDSMENRNPISREQVGIFYTSDIITAYKKVSDYFHNLSPIKSYLGYDGNIYPQWELESGELI